MLFIVNGRPGVGKTTFENLVKERVGQHNCTILSTVDFIKKIALEAGWNGEKTPESRAYLSKLKDLFTEWLDAPFNKIKESVERTTYELSREPFFIDANTQHIFFIDSREPNEIKRFCEKLGAKSIIVRRTTEESKVPSNHADAGVFDYFYNYTIYNDGSIEELQQEIDKWLNDIGYKYYKKDR